MTTYGNIAYTLNGSTTIPYQTLAGSVTGATWTTAASPYIYNSNSNSAIKIQGNADVAGDLLVQGVSIMETLNKINQRLAILVPDPKRLKQYEALQQAYEHYKTLEALCVEENNPDQS